MIARRIRFDKPTEPDEFGVLNRKASKGASRRPAQRQRERVTRNEPMRHKAANIGRVRVDPGALDRDAP